MRSRLTFGALTLLASACREPDLAPLRAELAGSAEIVCAAPAARPPHVAKARAVPPVEIEAALVKLCEEQAAHLEATPAPLAVLHEALAQDRAIIGELRRSRMLLTGGTTDLGTPASVSGRCVPSWPGLERFVLDAAGAQSKRGNAAEALERCADVVALARDEDLAGDLTDLLLANGHIQRAVEACNPLVDTAPKEAAGKLAASLTILRTTFPTSLDDVSVRDRAEMMLFHFGTGRDPSRPFPCERANALAKAKDGTPLTRGGRADLERAWRVARTESLTPDAKYLEAYTLTLRVLDQLIERAKTR